MLTGVGEVQAEQFRITAGRVVADGRRHPDHLPAEGDRDVAQHRVLPEPGVLGADVQCVVGQSAIHTTVSRAASSRTNSTLSA